MLSEEESIAIDLFLAGGAMWDSGKACFSSDVTSKMEDLTREYIQSLELAVLSSEMKGNRVHAC